MVNTIIGPPGFDGTEENDLLTYQAGPPEADPVADVIALGVLADATIDLLGGDDFVTGLAFTLAPFESSAFGIRNRGALLGNSGSDTLTGFSLIISSTDEGPTELGGFSFGISNSGSEGLISGGEDNDLMIGTAQGGIVAFGIRNIDGVISGDGGSDAINGTASGGAQNYGIANFGEISGGVGDDTMTGEAINTASLNKGFTNIGITNTGGKIYGDDPSFSAPSGNDELIGNASGGSGAFGGRTIIGIRNNTNLLTETPQFSVIDMGGGDDKLTGTASGGADGANVVGILNLRGNRILMGAGNDEVMATGGDRFSGYDEGGFIDLGEGIDTITGFGWQSVDGGTESDTAILGIDFTDVTEFATTDPANIDITAGGVTMSFTNVEFFEFLDQGMLGLSDLQALA